VIAARLVPALAALGLLAAPARARADDAPAPAGDAATAAPETDALTLVGASVFVYGATALLHEGVGHGLGCAVGGGTPTGVSLAVAQCDRAGMSDGGRRLEKIGGAGVNLLAGSALATSLLLAPPEDGSTYFALWLASVVNLYQTAGYLMVGPWVPPSDFGTEGALLGADPALPAQLGLSALGVGMTAGTLFLGNALAEPLLGDDPAVRDDRRWMTTMVPWITGATFVTASSLANREGKEGVVAAAMANFAGTLFLAYTPLFFADDTFYPARTAGSRALSIERDPLWIALGAATAVAAVTTFGPGVGSGFENPHPLLP
jgi:hypothetical protein